MKSFRKIVRFIRNMYVTVYIFYATLLVRLLDRSIKHLGKLGVLDLLHPLLTLSSPPKPPAPPVAIAVQPVERKRKQFMLPYVPLWVSAALKDPTLHPGYGGVDKYTKPILNAEEAQEIVAQVTEVGNDAID